MQSRLHPCLPLTPTTPRLQPLNAVTDLRVRVPEALESGDAPAGTSAALAVEVLTENGRPLPPQAALGALTLKVTPPGAWRRAAGAARAAGAPGTCEGSVGVCCTAACCLPAGVQWQSRLLFCLHDAQSPASLYSLHTCARTPSGGGKSNVVAYSLAAPEGSGEDGGAAGGLATEEGHYAFQLADLTAAGTYSAVAEYAEQRPELAAGLSKKEAALRSATAQFHVVAGQPVALRCGPACPAARAQAGGGRCGTLGVPLHKQTFSMDGHAYTSPSSQPNPTHPPPNPT